MDNNDQNSFQNVGNLIHSINQHITNWSKKTVSAHPVFQKWRGHQLIHSDRSLLLSAYSLAVVSFVHCIVHIPINIFFFNLLKVTNTCFFQKMILNRTDQRTYRCTKSDRLLINFNTKNPWTIAWTIIREWIKFSSSPFQNFTEFIHYGIINIIVHVIEPTYIENKVGKSKWRQRITFGARRTADLIIQNKLLMISGWSALLEFWII